MKNKSSKSIFKDTKSMVLVAVLCSILVLMTFTPLGLSLKIGLFEITFMCIPVAVGACMLGLNAGMFIGGFFGLLSLITAITGYSAFGAIIFGYSPIGTVIACVFARILCGFVPAVICSKFRTKPAMFIACFACSITNTIFFCGLVYLFCREAVGKAILIAGATNGIPEAIACTIIGGAVCTALTAAFGKRK